MKRTYDPKRILKPFLAVLLLFTVIFTSCKDDEVPEPALADQVIGEFEGDSYSAGSILVTLPATNAAGVIATLSITVKKISEKEVDFVFRFNLDKDGVITSSTSDSGIIALSKNSAGEISGTGTKGYSLVYFNDAVEVTIPDSDPSKTLVIKASK